MAILMLMCKPLIKSCGSGPQGCLSIPWRLLPNLRHLAAPTQPLDRAAGWYEPQGPAVMNSENFPGRHRHFLPRLGTPTTAQPPDELA